jgi:hypothetical protein
MISSKFFSLTILVGILIHGWAIGQPIQQAGDSSRTRMEWAITPRLNSAGHFPFTGSLVNQNINADINIFAESRNWGFFLFKSHDLQERNSLINYFQPGIFGNARLSDRIRLRFFVGYIFSQVHSFRDPDSDYYAAPVLYWTISEHLKLENCVLVYDIANNAKVANRFLVYWNGGKFRIDFYLWHRADFEDEQYATSAGLAINSPKFTLVGTAKAMLTASYQGYVSETKPGYARRDGFLFSLAFPVEW